MSLTPAQVHVANAYEQAFNGPHRTVLLDDLTEICNTMTDPLQRAGAMTLLLHIMRRTSLQRRHKNKETR